MIIQSIFEIILVALVILGIVFEARIAEWEQKIFAAIKRKFNDRKALSRREKFVVISHEYR